MKPHPRIDSRLALAITRQAPSSERSPWFDEHILAPALAEKRQGADDERVDVLFSYSGAVDSIRVAGLRVDSHDHGIASASLPLAQARRLADHPQVRYVELSRALYRSPAEVEPAPPDVGRSGAHFIGVTKLRELRPDLKGAGVVIGIIDSAIDFHHAAFRRVCGSTRIEALWVQGHSEQQGSEATSPRCHQYGREYPAALIDRDLDSGRPYSVVDHRIDVMNFQDRHGTIVSAIAAASDHDTDFPGVAPEASIVFVAVKPGEERSIGSTKSIADAIRYISACAGERPCVINLCVGDGLGPHDGTSLVERCIDDVSKQPGRVIVIAAGNTNVRDQHAHGVVARSKPDILELEVQPHQEDCPGASFQIWYDGPGLLDLTIRAADGQSRTFRPGAVNARESLGGVRFTASSLYKASGRRRLIEVLMEPAKSGDIAPSSFNLSLSLSSKARRRPRLTRWHAWIGDFTSPVVWKGDNLSHTVTLMTPATAQMGIAVGFQSLTLPQLIGNASGRGPTRDGRKKPELVAPGVGVRTAAPLPLAVLRDGLFNLEDGAKAGTSIAAPHVTGAAALLLQLLGPTADIREVRRILKACADPVRVGAPNDGAAWGELRVERFLEFAKAP